LSVSSELKTVVVIAWLHLNSGQRAITHERPSLSYQ
jgi:hypothetical protein